jgi:hypothetical protein
MKRYLRIAFSAVCGIICLLLIVLWVRSYWWMEKVLWVYQSPKAIRIFWGAGQVQVETASDNPIEITSSALGTFDWREPTFSSVAPPDATSKSLDHMLHKLDTGKAVPICFPVLATATLAALPWLRWRFSLRTLLIAMTLVAVVLGLIVWATS